MKTLSPNTCTLRKHEALLQRLGGDLAVKSVLTAMATYYPAYFQALFQAILEANESQAHALRHKILGTLSIVAEEKSPIFQYIEQTRQLKQADQEMRMALVEVLAQQEKCLIHEITHRLESLP